MDSKDIEWFVELFFFRNKTKEYFYFRVLKNLEIGVTPGMQLQNLPMAYKNKRYD